MLQYLLTGLAGVALGIVAMRVWQAREAGPDGKPASAAAEGDGPTAAGGGLGNSRNLLIGAGVLGALAIAVFALRGEGGTDPAAPTAPAAGASDQQLADVDTMIAGLAAKLEKNPDDGPGWRMLGWSYLMTGRAQQAIEPYKRALQLLPNEALVHSGYAEALTGVAGGKVTPEAKAEFDKALALDPKDPRARFFSGVWLAQNGKGKEALDLWIDLANSGPAGAPWQGDVQRSIKEEAGKQGVDVSSRLKVKPAALDGTVPPPPAAQAAAVSQLPPAEQQASIESMVDGLAAKLKDNPKNAGGWAMLIRSRMVLKQDAKAKEDLATARKALAGDEAGLAEVNAVAKQAGVPGA